MTSERESPEKYINTSEYIRRFNKIRTRFAAIVERGFRGKYKSVGILENGTTELERILTIAFATVMSPDVLGLSECAHRSVAACLVQKFPRHLEQNTIIGLQRGIAENAMLGSVIVSPNEDGDYLLVVGLNSWAFTYGLDTVPDKALLYCKTLPGLPHQIRRDHLRHLAKDAAIKDMGGIDSACPKRTQGVSCTIAHAEKVAYVISTELKKDLNLPQPERSLLTCTWIPCVDCVHLIDQDPWTVGDSPIEVFSVYAAMRDGDDVAMMQRIRSELAGGRGRLSGAYIGTSKEPGYGWGPALSSSIDMIKKSRYLKVGDHAEGETRKMMALLKSAVDLL